MQIAINISDNVYERIKYLEPNSNSNNLLDILLCSVQNGTPLPKGHGRLIDVDVLVDGMEDDYEFCEAVNATPTIIEGDTE